MTDFYIPRSGTITVAGHPYRLHKGVHPVPDVVSNSHEANDYGIKPTTEMTDEEWVALGLPVPTPPVVEKAAPKAAKA